MKTLKIAIIGTGNIARNNYVPVLAEIDDIELFYYSRTKQKATALADKFGGIVVGSLPALMENDPDAIFLLTRENDRYGAAMSVLGFSPHRIFFEKPLVAAAGQSRVQEDDFFKAREILNLAKKQNCETAMIFNYRFFDQTMLAKQIIAERNFGEIVNFTGYVHYSTWSHCIDLLRFFGGQVKTVTALGGEKEHVWGEEPVAEDIVAAFTMKNSATGTFLGTQAPPMSCPLFELIINFEHGRIHMRGLDGNMEVLDCRNPRHELYSITRDTSRWDQYTASFSKSINAYIKSIATNSPPPIPGIEGLYELQFEAALKRSIAERRPVILNDEFSVTEKS